MHPHSSLSTFPSSHHMNSGHPLPTWSPSSHAAPTGGAGNDGEVGDIGEVGGTEESTRPALPSIVLPYTASGNVDEVALESARFRIERESNGAHICPQAAVLLNWGGFWFAPLQSQFSSRTTFPYLLDLDRRPSPPCLSTVLLSPSRTFLHLPAPSTYCAPCVSPLSCIGDSAALVHITYCCNPRAVISLIKLRNRIEVMKKQRELESEEVVEEARGEHGNDDQGDTLEGAHRQEDSE